MCRRLPDRSRARIDGTTRTMSANDNASCTLLVVDDNEDNREILRARLHQLALPSLPSE